MKIATGFARRCSPCWPFRSPVSTAFIGLGSNLGDRLSNLRRAVTKLTFTDRMDVLVASSVYETDPVGPPQPDFLNAVVEIRTTLGPRELLDVLKDIEAALGRSEGARWGPREIDLDLLLYGDKQVNTAGLSVPHPEMTKRAFVLVPLAEIAPDVIVPGAGAVAELRERVDDAGVRLFAGPETLS